MNIRMIQGYRPAPISHRIPVAQVGAIPIARVGADETASPPSRMLWFIFGFAAGIGGSMWVVADSNKEIARRHARKTIWHE